MVFRGSDGSEAVFALVGDSVAGSLHSQGRSWRLQGCGPGCFLWQAHTPAWPGEVAMEEERLQAERGEYLGLQQRGQQDTTTLVMVSILPLIKY